MTFQLYDWQQEDINKLKDSPIRLIGSEMGAGKSFQAGALNRIAAPDKGDRSLWLGPLSTLRGSRDKLVQMGIDVPMTIIDPKNRNKSWNAFIAGKEGIFFCHWDVLRILIQEEEFAKQIWAEIIGDEIQRVQNRSTKQTKALKKLKAGAKTGLSGTHITTGSADRWWSVLNWFDRKEYSSYWRFYKRYVEYLDLTAPNGQSYKKFIGNINEAELLNKVSPFYVRHLKKQQCCPHHPLGVMPWLPDKYYTEYPVDLGPQQRRAYNDMNKDMLSWVGANEDKPLPAQLTMTQLMRLQQFAIGYCDLVPGRRIDDPDNVKMTEPSTKLDAVMQILEDNPDTRVVIWSQFKQVVYLLNERLKKANIETFLYTGDNVKYRDSYVKSFSAGQGRVFVGTISAGGEGVDGLQNSCSTMIFTDRMWNTAKNAQAEDRLWRDGQRNPVQIIDIMATDTLDKGRHQTLGQTWAEIKKLLGDRG